MDWERVEWAVELLGTVKMTILTPFEKRLEWERGRAIKGGFPLCFVAVIVNGGGRHFGENPAVPTSGTLKWSGGRNVAHALANLARQR